MVIVSNPLTLRVYKDFYLDISTAIDWEFLTLSLLLERRFYGNFVPYIPMNGFPGTRLKAIRASCYLLNPVNSGLGVSNLRGLGFAESRRTLTVRQSADLTNFA